MQRARLPRRARIGHAYAAGEAARVLRHGQRRTDVRTVFQRRRGAQHVAGLIEHGDPRRTGLASRVHDPAGHHRRAAVDGVGVIDEAAAGRERGGMGVRQPGEQVRGRPVTAGKHVQLVGVQDGDVRPHGVHGALEARPGAPLRAHVVGQQLGVRQYHALQAGGAMDHRRGRSPDKARPTRTPARPRGTPRPEPSARTSEALAPAKRRRTPGSWWHSARRAQPPCQTAAGSSACLRARTAPPSGQVPPKPRPPPEQDGRAAETSAPAPRRRDRTAPGPPPPPRWRCRDTPQGRRR